MATLIRLAGSATARPLAMLGASRSDLTISVMSGMNGGFLSMSTQPLTMPNRSTAHS